MHLTIYDKIVRHKDDLLIGIFREMLRERRFNPQILDETEILNFNLIIEKLMSRVMETNQKINDEYFENVENVTFLSFKNIDVQSYNDN